MKKIKVIGVVIFIAIFSVILFGQSQSAQPDITGTTTPRRSASGAGEQTGIGLISTLYEAGGDAYKEGDKAKAQSLFERAESEARSFIAGIISPADEAQAKYFRGVSLYYLGRLTNDNAKYEQAGTALREARDAFINVNKLSEFYLDCKYRIGLCSFRQAELAKIEDTKAKRYSEANGDFRDFLEDPALNAFKTDLIDKIENAKYLSSLSLFSRGTIKMYQVAEYGSAKSDFTSSAAGFAELSTAKNQQIAVVSRLMEGLCHYYLARLYMQVSPDDWGDRKLSAQSRDAAISSELETADNRIKSARSSMGTFSQVEPFITWSQYANRIAKGASGETKELQTVLEDLAKQAASGNWVLEKDMRSADVQLLRYFIGDKPASTAVGGWQGLVGKTPIANYWMGWIRFIEALEAKENYPQASSQFSSFIAREAPTTKDLIMRADAKFRDAECTFWDGTLRESAPMLQDAKLAFQSLTATSGPYYRYLPEHLRQQAEVRIQIIEVQEYMTIGTSDINNVITGLRMKGFDLPAGAKAYLNFGRYFLEKANREASTPALRDIALAVGLFDHVAKNSSVQAEIRNEATFLKGISYVKKAARTEDKAGSSSAMSDASNVLNTVTGVFANEAKYAIGVGYYNIQDYGNTQTALADLKDRFIRPAFVYALSNANCVTKGTYLKRVMASLERNDPWYIKAQLAFDKLDCAGNVPPQSGGLRETGSPITYESLADAKAQMEELKAEALLIWQKVSAGVILYSTDDLIPDLPPKTTITVIFAIKDTDGKPISGDHKFIIDNDPTLATKVEREPNKFKATLSQSAHDILVETKGYYRYFENIPVSEGADVEIILHEAVRYVKSPSNLPESQQPMAIASSAKQLFVANNAKKTIFRRTSDGELIGTIPYKDIKVSAVTGMAVDGDYVLVVDGRAGQIKLVNADGSDFQVIANKDPLGGKSLSKPSSVVVVEGKYYIVDCGNSRVIVLEGKNFRSKFGEEELEHPFGIAHRVSDNAILVTDIVLGKVFIYDLNGEFKKSIELDNQRSPGSIYVDADGFIFIADYVTGLICKYTKNLDFIEIVSSDIIAPVSMSQVGSGQKSTIYVASKDAVSILKGSWNNAYIPSK